MNDQNGPEINKKFICEKCNYKSATKRDFDKHLATAKHKKICNVIVENSAVEPTEFNCNCGKKYKFRQGLHLHKQKCDFTENINLKCEECDDDKVKVKVKVKEKENANAKAKKAKKAKDDNSSDSSDSSDDSEEEKECECIDCAKKNNKFDVVVSKSLSDNIKTTDDLKNFIINLIIQNAQLQQANEQLILKMKELLPGAVAE
jgi:hypothetical protein